MTMAKLNLGLVVLSISLASLFAPTWSRSGFSEGLDQWCNRTPHRETCKYSWRQCRDDPKSFKFRNTVPKSKSEFKKLVTEIALRQAVRAEGHNKGLGARCRNARERAAWSDCVKLYENSIQMLNKTLTLDPASPSKRSASDAQTWLSAALTDLETCRAGFVDLGVTDYVLPLMSNNVSELISNTLALGGGEASAPPRPEGEVGYPSWLSAGNRRLLQSSVSPNIVVAKDGSGHNLTIKAALDVAARRSGSGRFVIRVKSGVYEENLEISGSKLKNIMLLGDGMKTTIITGNRSVGGGATTFNSSTVAVTAEGFIAQGITFRNTAGPANHQAVALRSGADLSVFYRCGFEGYQDTLYTHSNRQFYKECYIYGTVDFIFGNAAAVLQNCMIYARRPMDKQKNTVTAQGRTDPNQNTGLSIHNSRVMAGPDLAPVKGSFKTYLGRPWKEFSRTVFLQSFLDTLVDPAGWLEWDGEFALKTLFYGEYNNMGPASPTGGRVKWPGYRVMQNASEAMPFTTANFIAGQSWLPGTRVPFTAGL